MRLRWIGSLAAFVRYSASQVFARKFIFFLLLALLTFCVVVVVHTLQEEIPPNAASVYYFLLVPGLLLTLYPSAYAVQSETDARMLETLFGIPDYRFKVWLARHLVQHLVIAGILLLLAQLCDLALADLPVWEMVFHLMFPIMFLSSVGFMLATLFRSGNGAAAIMLLVGIVFWMSHGAFDGSRWSIYINPFEQAGASDYIARNTEVYYNRAYLGVGIVLTTLLALLRLQRRELFV